ncbi:hypothetical protein K435DRAFT_782222 [Dendrothele bispora CBS 962.96]|uniref:Uncharacterized protein n=1 Tax=Dendrothele bispora (strain CBS 962.96) TaxID=1314807 RepID=A0A4S8LGM8_DENBC|nr:hypothetical protein K435DRAFT_782222 [Dendrothele bispora CBS 962.96]
MTDPGVMQDRCGFGFEVGGDHRFCEVFNGAFSHFAGFKKKMHTDHDLKKMNGSTTNTCMILISMYYGSGPGNPLSATVGFSWLKVVTDLFEVGPGNTVENGTLLPPPLIVGFSVTGTTTTLIFHLSSPLSVYGILLKLPHFLLPRAIVHLYQPESSHLVSFLGNVAIKHMSCIIGGPSSEQAMRKIRGDRPLVKPWRRVENDWTRLL